jgi:rubrerythrin
MLNSLTVKQVLETAILKEIESQQLYADLGSRVTEDAAKEAFRELANQEKAHQRFIERYLRGERIDGALACSQLIDFKIAEHFREPEPSPQMALKDAFLLAANREKLSYEFYHSLAAVHPVGEVRRTLEDLAGQELGHKARVEFLFTQVAFPQTDGG